MKRTPIAEWTKMIIKQIIYIKFICIYSTLTLFFCFLTKNNFAQTFDKCAVKNTTTFDGEKIKYKVYYTFAGIYVPAGEATFSNKIETYKQKTVYHLQGEGHTLSSYDWFYKVRDLYESYVDTNTMLPLFFSRKISEASTKYVEQIVFDREANKAMSNKKTFDVSACIQDVLSTIYFARNIDFYKIKVDEKIPFNMFLENTNYDLYIRYLGKAKLNIKGKTYNTIKFKPKLIEGTIFKGGEEMTVYVSDDKYKIPIYIETPILVGKIKVYWIK